MTEHSIIVTQLKWSAVCIYMCVFNLNRNLCKGFEEQNPWLEKRGNNAVERGAGGKRDIILLVNCSQSWTILDCGTEYQRIGVNNAEHWTIPKSGNEYKEQWWTLNTEQCCRMENNGQSRGSPVMTCPCECSSTKTAPVNILGNKNTNKIQVTTGKPHSKWQSNRDQTLGVWQDCDNHEFYNSGLGVQAWKLRNSKRRRLSSCFSLDWQLNTFFGCFSNAKVLSFPRGHWWNTRVSFLCSSQNTGETAGSPGF